MNDGWIGVDLDGTLAEDRAPSGTYNGEIGAPVPLMVARIQEWRRQGIVVKIMTARVSPINRDGARKTLLAEEMVREKIQLWCKQHIGEVLPITCEKDYAMLQLWDDRAIQVIKNTGIRVGDVER